MNSGVVRRYIQPSLTGSEYRTLNFTSSIVVLNKTRGYKYFMYRCSLPIAYSVGKKAVKSVSEVKSRTSDAYGEFT